MNIVEQANLNPVEKYPATHWKKRWKNVCVIRQSGLVRHGEICEMLKRELGVGHGDANTLVTFYLKSLQEQSVESSLEELVAEIYSGSRASLHPIHDAVMKAVSGFGEFEIVPKKGYLSLRRKRQFAMVGPASRGRLEVGLNMKNVDSTERLQAQPPGGMCQYKVYLTSPMEVDDELMVWIRQAYERAG
jgi:hypothetical protein